MGVQRKMYGELVDLSALHSPSSKVQKMNEIIMGQVKQTSEETYPEQSKSFEETSKLPAQQVTEKQGAESKEKETLKTEVDVAIDETNTMNTDKLKANKAEVEANNKDSETFIESKSEKVVKGKGKKGKDKKAKAEAGKDSMLEATRFETQAKDKADAAEMVRP